MMKDAILAGFAEPFREPNTPFLSPERVSKLFGLQVQELAEGAHVHRNTPTARPQSPQLQAYMRDLLRVLSVASELTEDRERAVFLVRNEPLRAFDHKTADTLVKEGRADAVIAYLKSFAGGAAG